MYRAKDVPTSGVLTRHEETEQFAVVFGLRTCGFRHSHRPIGEIHKGNPIFVERFRVCSDRHPLVARRGPPLRENTPQDPITPRENTPQDPIIPRENTPQDPIIPRESTPQDPIIPSIGS